MSSPLQEDVTFLEHYGVKGMKWGQRRKARKEQKRKAKEAEYKKFTQKVLKDIKGRSPSELYAIRGSHGNIITTGEEFVRRVNMGMTFTSIVSTGQQINDGR